MRSSSGRPPASLVIDAASKQIQVGIFTEDQWISKTSPKGDALETLFNSLESVLKSSGYSLQEIQSLYFCEGPGSLLGLRLAAMAVQTWKILPEFSELQLLQYSSMELGACSIAQTLRVSQPFHLLCSFRKGQYIHTRKSEETSTSYSVIDYNEAATLEGDVFLLDLNGKASLDKLPVTVRKIDYSFDALPRLISTGTISPRANTKPEVLIPESPIFKRWDAKRHSASSGSGRS